MKSEEEPRGPTGRQVVKSEEEPRGPTGRQVVKSDVDLGDRQADRL